MAAEETYSFFDSVGDDRLYNAEQFATYFRKFLSTGIYMENNRVGFRVDRKSDTSVTVQDGSAFIEGYMYNLSDVKELKLDPPDSVHPRRDRIVLRLDRTQSQRNIKLLYRKGEPNRFPQPPAMIRNNMVYEISLAMIVNDAEAKTFTRIEDERLDPNTAGMVSSLITVPFEEFKREWDEWFNKIVGKTYVVGGMTLTVGDTAPTGPRNKDIWIDTK